MSSEVEMPKFVDSQQQVLWWEADQFLIAAVIFGVGIMMHTIVYPVLILIVLMPIISRLKAEALEGAALHKMASTGLFPLNKEFDDLLEREFYL